MKAFIKSKQQSWQLVMLSMSLQETYFELFFMFFLFHGLYKDAEFFKKISVAYHL